MDIHVWLVSGGSFTNPSHGDYYLHDPVKSSSGIWVNASQLHNLSQLSQKSLNTRYFKRYFEVKWL